MKQSTFFFLVLILAASVVTGSTLGVASNFALIKSTAQNQNQSVTNNASINKSVPKQSSAADKTAQANKKTDATVQTASASSDDKSTELMVVTPEESAQITSMLVKLGMTGDDSDQFVKQYQESHGIQPTGNIDSVTLNSIINDVKLQRAHELTKQ